MLEIEEIMIGKMIEKRWVGYFCVGWKFVEVLVYVGRMVIESVSGVVVKEGK